MAGKRRRRIEVRTDSERTPPRPRNTRRKGSARLRKAHPFPHRLADNKDTTHTDRTPRGSKLLHTAPQNGLQHRLRGLWRRARSGLRRHTLIIKRKLRELLHPGICERLRLYIRRCRQQERHRTPQPHHRKRTLTVSPPLRTRNRCARNNIAARNAGRLRTGRKRPPTRERPLRNMGQPQSPHDA